MIAAASAPRAPCDVRLLCADDGEARVQSACDLPALLHPADVVVVNDAATLPASLTGTLNGGGDCVELRLARATGMHGSTARFVAIALGAGNHRTRTEERAAPRLVPGDVVHLAQGLRARVQAVSARSPRLVDIELRAGGDGPSALLEALYRAGKPVQYAHVPEALALWDVQTAWGGPPWAVEVPSAALSLRAATVLALRARGIRVVSITHAAGLSSTGDAALDAELPFPERWRVAGSTRAVVDGARARGGRVIAVGTSVVRALESAARAGGVEEGVTDLRLGAETELRIVDALVTGVHVRGTSHFDLLSAFLSREVLERWLVLSEREGLRQHEFGDLWLVWKAAGA